jgi:CHAT domain-containing protein/tetratricopeptide (TPR) repeat protein
MDKVCANVAHPSHALVLSNLSLVKVRQRDYAAARPMMAQAIDILLKTRGVDDLMLWLVRQNLAETYLEDGNWAVARQLLDDAEAGLRKSIAGNQGSKFERLRVLSYVLINQAEVDSQTGNFARQRARLREALGAIAEMEQALGGKATIQRAITLFSLGRCAARDVDGNFEEGEKALLESRDLLANLVGKQHPLYALVLESLAELYLRRDGEGDRARALGLIEQAIQIRRNLGNDRIDPGSWVKLKVDYLQRAGQYADAADLAKKYADYLAQGLGANHPETLRAKLALSRLLDAVGDGAAAEKVLVEALAAVRQRMDVTFAVQSEKEQLAMTRVYREYLDAMLSRTNEQNREAAQRQAIAWKGAVFRRQRLVRSLRNTDAATKALFDEFASAASRLAALVHHREAHPEAVAERDNQIAALARRVEGLEAKVARMTTIEDDTAELLKLPEGAALVDLHRYRAVRPPAARRGRWIEENRYIAFVRRGEGSSVIDLGPAMPIETALAAWRKDQRFATEHGRALRDLVWRPIEAALSGDINVVLISPDGALGTLPFAALPLKDGGSGYLIERYAFAALPMPSMMTGVTRTTRGDGMLLVGEIDFDQDGQSSTSPAAVASQTLRARSGARWERLSGAAAEISDVSGIYRGRVEKLTASAATKDAFTAAASGKRFVHLATHGFFTDSADSGVDPAMLSGLCLAGANVVPAIAPDGTVKHGGGILTAAEVAQLDLAGTQTVVLSACETGLGTAASGEGLLGIQRAFQIAGAQSVVASLWKVDDGATRELMRRLYRQMIEFGRPAPAALRQAPLEML